MTTSDRASDRVLVLTGPTAIGKKEIGFLAARRLGAEVIAMDSVKVYRGFAIGSAQPTAADERDLKVHLVEIADPDSARPFSVGRYLELARRAVEEARGRGRLPLFIGGTPLYLQGLLRGFFAGPAADSAIRARIEQEVRELGVEALHRRLATVDPVASTRILPRDEKRITRALEVYELTGRPISELQAEGTQPPIPGTFRVVGLHAERELLDRRQGDRIARMLRSGLVDEVRHLVANGKLQGEAALAIGYREVAAHLRGELTRDEAEQAIHLATRRLTRKQRKWFRRFPEIRWVERTERSDPSDLLAAVIEQFESD